MTAPSEVSSVRVGFRVRPAVWLGLLAYAGYLAVFCSVWIVNGIDYPHIGDNESTLLRWYVVPLAVGAVAITAFVTAYGWWRPALFDTRRLPRGVWTLPVIMAAAAVLNLVGQDFGRVTTVMWVYLIVGSLMVGYNEELMTRGQLVVALRSRFGEFGVWLLSTALFALIHLPNTLFGTGAGGVLQVPVTFLLGSVFYLLRRVSGTLIAAMFLHALWDFSSFAAVDGWVVGLIGPPVGIAAVIVAAVLTRREGAPAS